MKGSVRQRSPGSWELTVDLGRDPLGKRPRRHQTVRGTKALAQRKLRELLSNLDRGLGIPDGGIRLRDWLDRWMEDVIEPNRRQGTKERYRDIIDNYILPFLGGVELIALGPAHIQTLEKRLSEQLTPKGVQQVHIVLGGALKYALRLEFIARNPVSLVSPPPSKRRELPPPDIPAVRRALDLARDEGHELYPAMRLIAYTGLRRGEALGLMWEHVDLNEEYVKTEGSLVRSRELGLILQPPQAG